MAIDWTKYPESATHQEVMEKIMKEDPEFRKAWEESAPLRRLISAIVGGRIKKGWTQTELANAAGTSQSSIARLESGVHEPRWTTIVRVCDALELPLRIGDTILTGTQALSRYRR